MRRICLVLALWLATPSAVWASAYSDFNAGIAARNRGDVVESIRLLSSAIMSPGLPAHLRSIAYFDRGTAYFSNKQADLALADLTACLSLSPGYLPALEVRGYAYQSTRKYDLAQKDFEVIATQRPEIMNGPYAIVMLQWEQKHFDLALKASERIVVVWPDSATGYMLRAAINRDLGKYQVAVADYTTAISKQSRNGQALAGRGAAYRDAGEIEKAESDYQDAAKTDPSNIFWAMQVGYLQWSLGRFRDADRTFRRIIAGRNPTAYTFLWLYLSTTKFASAEQIQLADGWERIDTLSWPGPVLKVFSGAMQASDLLGAANSADAETQSNQRCEANFYAGEWLLLHNDRANGQRLLSDAAKDCSEEFIERRAAEIELDRLRSAGGVR